MATTDEWVRLILSDEVDIRKMPDTLLRDLIGCLKMRTAPAYVDACTALLVAAICNQLRAKQDPDNVRALASEIGCDLSRWTDEQLGAAVAGRTKFSHRRSW